MKDIINKSIDFRVALKTLPQKGNLVYEYNPLRNYRINKKSYSYKNRLYSPKELLIELGFNELQVTKGEESVKIEKKYKDKNEEEQTVVAKLKLDTNDNIEIQATDDDCLEFIGKVNDWKLLNVPDSETDPTLLEKGAITDFETDELSFDLSKPVQILPQYSYDNSVNLIINDGKNIPRLINSRFSATEKNKYQIVDRKGENDTNIYDQGDQFDLDTSLIKRVINIPKIKFIGVELGGKLSVGNYHFYFTYVDSDGNETDIVGESGLVSLFIGQYPTSVLGGFRNENTHKRVNFQVSNIDTSYKYMQVYYTKSTSDINENSVTSAYKIDQKFIINTEQICNINISGYESVDEITLAEINPQYQSFDYAQTQTSSQNRLFLGNIHKPDIPYKDLIDISLRFVPQIKATEYNPEIDQDYNISKYESSYYNPYFIYNKTGYWNHEIYRFGIVYILRDGTLSPVFNIRGINKLTKEVNYNTYSNDDFIDEKGNRQYITYDENTYIISSNKKDSKENNSSEKGSKENQTDITENAGGVVKFDYNSDGNQNIYSINFSVDSKVLEYIKDTLKCRGFFFVRQKRIPTILCQAYLIGIEKKSHTPVIPYDNKYYTETFLSKNDRVLTNSFEDRFYEVDEKYVETYAAICPEYDVDTPYYNNLFNGGTFNYSFSDVQYNKLKKDIRNFYSGTATIPDDINSTKSAKILGVEDNVKLVSINSKLFSSRAGEAEEAFHFEHIGFENKTNKADNLLRGSFGPYLGIVHTESKITDRLIDIKIPGLNQLSWNDLTSIRINDASPFYAISDRIDLNYTIEWFSESKGIQTLRKPLYRGDCYICQFTHRINRNFQDPSAPSNDKIVDDQCWANNFEYSDGVLKKENFDKINLGDVNAIQLGMWITLTVRSSKNLNIRSLDESNTDEAALFGHPRSFFPQYPINGEGAYKIPEALCYNKGFEKSVSERYNFIVPDVPTIKNEFSNRISYSDIHVNDAFKNGYRTFRGTHFRDYPKTYGSITKILELRGNILCVFEHGVALIPVNERVEAGNGSGGYVYVNTSNVLPENPKIISDTFGSQWKESIIQTPAAVYGVDTIGKKIWRTNGEMFECISDFKVQEFLNNNISLTERELDPIIGVRNVKTHYNKFKHDVMFTFYDNLHGFEEKVWNLCYNELLQKWVTFYSWVPSYSENIYNQYFSFDRNTSKWITKLGVSHTGNDFADGVTLSNNIIPNNAKSGYKIGELTLSNRELPKGSGISCEIDYSLQKDSFGNWKNFEIIKEGTTYYLCLKSSVQYRYNRSKNKTSKDQNTSPEDLLSTIWSKGIPIRNSKEYPYVWRKTIKNISTTNEMTIYEQTDQKLKNISGVNAIDLCSELFERYNTSNPNEKITDLSEDSQQIVKWKNDVVLNSKYKISKDDCGRRINLTHSDIKDCRRNPNRIVSLLNIKADIKIKYENAEDITLAEAYSHGFNNGMEVDGGYYKSVVAVIPEYNQQFLTTDFWKHGQAGIIDISDTINPCYWYGKQHPFEFEFIVADNPQAHKIFDNLAIISNNAEPESFHYEIIGDCFNFAKDKKNMYIRQEATKELYQYNGSDITFDPDYSKLTSEHRKNYIVSNGKKQELDSYDRSTLLPLYYQRQDTINEIEDSYHLKNDGENKDFSALAGGEIVHYKTLDEYRIWNHAKAVDITDPEKGRLRGNMHYKEDEWYVQINPLNIVEKNERQWEDLDGKDTNKVPVELGQNPIPSEVLKKDELEVPQTDSFKNRGYTTWDWNESQNQEVKMKDKWIKIRVRYTGNKLSIISAVRTMYSLSYS